MLDVLRASDDPRTSWFLQEEQRRIRVEGALEQGVSGSLMGPSKKSWVGNV